MLVAEGSLVKDEREEDKKQQKRENAAIGFGSVSAIPGDGLGSAEVHSSSEGHSYGRYSLGSESIGLSSGSTDQGNTGIISSTIGLSSTGLSSGGFESGLKSGNIVFLTVKGLEHGSGLGSGGYSLGSRSFKGVGFGGDLREGASATGRVQVTTVTQPVPVPVPQPVPVTVNRPVPLPVPAPYLVEVPRPVPVSIPHPVRVIVNRPYTVTVTRPVLVPVPQPVPAPVPRPYIIAIPQPAPLQISQPVAVPVSRPVTVALPHPVAVSSVTESDVGRLGPFVGDVYSSGASYSSSVASVRGSGHSGSAGGLGYSSGSNTVYKSNDGSSGSDLGQVSTPLKGVYVPSYLGGLHGSYGGPNLIQGSGYVERYSRSADHADRPSKGLGH